MGKIILASLGSNAASCGFNLETVSIYGSFIFVVPVLYRRAFCHKNILARPFHRKGANIPQPKAVVFLKACMSPLPKNEVLQL